MKAVFLPLFSAWLLATCGNTQANVGPVAQYVAPVTEMAASLEAEETVAEPQGAISWDKTLHDFGDVSVADGPLTCTFTVTNNSDEPIAILEVATSCGCTDVKWTREPLQKGKSGTISATYKNEDGPTAFDKTLTVYITGVRRPVVLHLRGVVHEQKKSLSQLYGAQKLGDFGLKTRSFKTGNVKQGLSASETAKVANLGKKPLQVSFTECSPQLEMSVSPNPIPAAETATLSFTVKADPSLYGRQLYRATPVLNGKKSEGSLEVVAWTQENFMDWSEEQRKDAAVPMFEASTFNFGIVKAGETVDVTFVCLNKGNSPLHFFKIDPENPAVEAFPLPDIAPGQKESVRMTLDTSSLEKGENVIMVSLTTNSPLRPLVNLFVAGEIR